MKHKIGFNALNRRTAERKALKRNMVTSLFRYEKIETTKVKAKEVQRLAEKLITRAKVETVSVDYEMKEDNIGYIQVTEFVDTTAKQFKEAVNDLQNQGMEKLMKRD